MIDNKTLKKYMKVLSNEDKEKLIKKIQKLYEKKYKQLLVCHSCKIGISKNEKYVKDEYGHIHIVCRYKELKEDIKDEKEKIEQFEKEIVDRKLEIKELEKEIISLILSVTTKKKSIEKIQQKINNLGQKYSDEIVKEVL